MPWVPEAHERATPEHPGSTSRIRSWWRRIIHPHTDLLDQLTQTGPNTDLILIHPHTGNVIALTCPTCHTWHPGHTTCTTCTPEPEPEPT